MSIRQLQVESQLLRVVGTLLQRRLSDPRIRGMVSVTRVNVSSDLKQAAVYISVLDQRYEKRAIQGLRHARGRIQQMVRRSIAIKAVPTLDFKLDSTLKKQAEVFAAIADGMDREGQSK